MLTLGEKVQRIREKMGWTRKELADRAGLHPSHIGLIERGGRTEVRPETVSKLAVALEVPLIYLMTDDPIEYAKFCFADLQGSALHQKLHISFTGRPFELKKQYIVDDVREKWGDEAADLVGASSEIDRLIDPYKQGVNDDCSSGKQTWRLDKRVAAALMPPPPDEYQLAVDTAKRNGITGADLLAAVEFLLKVKQSPTDTNGSPS